MCEGMILLKVLTKRGRERARERERERDKAFIIILVLINKTIKAQINLTGTNQLLYWSLINKFQVLSECITANIPQCQFDYRLEMSQENKLKSPLILKYFFKYIYNSLIGRINHGEMIWEGGAGGVIDSWPQSDSVGGTLASGSRPWRSREDRLAWSYRVAGEPTVPSLSGESQTQQRPTEPWASLRQCAHQEGEGSGSVPRCHCLAIAPGCGLPPGDQRRSGGQSVTATLSLLRFPPVVGTRLAVVVVLCLWDGRCGISPACEPPCVTRAACLSFQAYRGDPSYKKCFLTSTLSTVGFLECFQKCSKSVLERHCILFARNYCYISIRMFRLEHSNHMFEI